MAVANFDLVFQFLGVDSILIAQSGPLVCDEVAAPNKSHRNISIHAPDDIDFSIGILHAVDPIKQINARWGDTKGNHIAGYEEYVLRQIFGLEPKRDERTAQARYVRRGRVEIDVDVLGKPWVTVECDGITTDNHVVNAVLFE